MKAALDRALNALALVVVAVLLGVPALGIAATLAQGSPLVFAVVVAACVAILVVPGQGQVPIKESFFDGF